MSSHDNTTDTPVPPNAAHHLAGLLHEQWRATRRHTDGTYTPRWKPTDDGGEVDIANTAFNDLPERWQVENLAAARHAIQWVTEHPDGTVEEAAAAIHDAWVTRNDTAPPELRVPYEHLTEQEKEKDRTIAHLARTALTPSHPDEPA